MKRRRLRRKAHVGEPLIVRLSAPGTAGYQWVFTPDTAWRPAGQQAEASQHMGGPMTILYRFEPLVAGRFVISGVLQRPWESEPIEALDITVIAE